jgi:hypothetical protein
MVGLWRWLFPARLSSRLATVPVLLLRWSRSAWLSWWSAAITVAAASSFLRRSARSACVSLSFLASFQLLVFVQPWLASARTVRRFLRGISAAGVGRPHDAFRGL